MKKLFCSGLIAFVFTLTIFTIVEPHHTEEVKARDRFAKLDGNRVHFQDYGNGNEALVFVHGWSCNLNFWKANIPAFANRTRVIAIDLPGHGESDKPQIKYSMDLFANAIDAVLNDANVERATLVGHSMGTPVIRQFYRKYPNKTRALVIVDGALRPFFNSEESKKFLDPFRGPDYKQHAEQMIGFLSSSVKSKETLNEIKTAMLSTPQHVMVGAMDAMMDESIWKTQDKINVPTLAVMAKQPAWTEDYEKFIRELVPGIDYRMWEGVSHFLMMDEPQKFNETVTAFLNKNKLIK